MAFVLGGAIGGVGVALVLGVFWDWAGQFLSIILQLVRFPETGSQGDMGRG